MPYIMPQKEKRLKVLKDELEKAINFAISLKPEKVILFGLLEKEDIHLRSDIDLLIIWKTDLPFLERLQVFYDAIEPNIVMDILVYPPEEIEKLYRENKFITKVFR